MTHETYSTETGMTEFVTFSHSEALMMIEELSSRIRRNHGGSIDMHNDFDQRPFSFLVIPDEEYRKRMTDMRDKR